MRHRIHGRRLNRSSAHRTALRKNLVADLICHEQIVTTEAKARTIRPAAEKMITLAKRGLAKGQDNPIDEVHARRLAAARLPKTRVVEDDDGYFDEINVVKHLFEEVAPRFVDRPGGYTRMVKIGKRPGDNAEMAVLMLVDEDVMGDPPAGHLFEMTRYRALIEYDGTNYFGFQRQREGVPTIQGELESVLSQLVRKPVTITGAGRTDSGVHALGQVVSFTIEWQHGVGALNRALNANLPGDIAARTVEETSPNFHPRYDARRRAYRYLVYNAPVRSPLRRLHSWHVRQALELDAMNEAAALLLGVHDFVTFGLPPQGDNSVRELFQAYWNRAGEFLQFSIEANAFLVPHGTEYRWQFGGCWHPELACS